MSAPYAVNVCMRLVGFILFALFSIQSTVLLMNTTMCVWPAHLSLQQKNIFNLVFLPHERGILLLFLSTLLPRFVVAKGAALDCKDSLSHNVAWAFPHNVQFLPSPVNGLFISISDSAGTEAVGAGRTPIETKLTMYEALRATASVRSVVPCHLGYCYCC